MPERQAQAAASNLLVNGRYMHIMGIDPNGKVKFDVIDRYYADSTYSKAYIVEHFANPALKEGIFAFYYRPTRGSFANMHPDTFLEVPKPAIALVATAVKVFLTSAIYLTYCFRSSTVSKRLLKGRMRSNLQRMNTETYILTP